MDAVCHLRFTERTSPSRLTLPVTRHAPFSRDALKKGGDLGKHQMTLVPPGQGQGQEPEESPSAGAFDGPFPVVDGECFDRNS